MGNFPCNFIVFENDYCIFVTGDRVALLWEDKPPEELVLEGMLAQSSDRIPVGDEVRPSATHERRGSWGDLWSEE